MKGKEKVLAYLIEARNVIADEGSWIQRYMSEDAEGYQCRSVRRQRCIFLYARFVIPCYP